MVILDNSFVSLLYYAVLLFPLTLKTNKYPLYESRVFILSQSPFVTSCKCCEARPVKRCEQTLRSVYLKRIVVKLINNDVYGNSISIQTSDMLLYTMKNLFIK